MASVEVKPSPEGVPGAVSDPGRIAAEQLSFAGADGDQVNAYAARPAEGGSHPAVIVIHEAGGLGDHIRDVSNRFANIGYVALAVDLYTREGGPPPMDDPPKLMERLFSIPDARVLGDLEGAAGYLRSAEDVTGRLGCIGFCMGGRYTLLFACSSDHVNAAVDCWGGFIDKATPEERSTPERPVPPLERVQELRCPLLAAIGAEDQNPSPEVGAQLLERARLSGQEVKVDVYEGASHAFFADHRPMYRSEPAAKLWKEIVPFFSDHLQGG
ncbi:MAG TPA: dienelactone hydrolase family protein [Solirubrobacteraceae bacterium]|jgi:carboxymethylenebutenolidase|nr:dienelactone hydrolase family protein [Solirubrobacteraceae bacterium]